MSDPQDLHQIILVVCDCGLFNPRAEVVAEDLIRAAYALGLSAGQARQVDSLPDVYQMRDARALPAPGYHDYRADRPRERSEYPAPVILGGRYER